MQRTALIRAVTDSDAEFSDHREVKGVWLMQWWLFESFTNLRGEDRAGMAGSSLFKGGVQLRSLVRFCSSKGKQSCKPWDSEWGCLKSRLHGRDLATETCKTCTCWNPEYGKKMWLYSSEVFCVVNPQNLLKSVRGIFSRILGHIALTFSKLQHANNKVLCGLLLWKRGDDRSQLLFCF